MLLITDVSEELILPAEIESMLLGIVDKRHDWDELVRMATRLQEWRLLRIAGVDPMILKGERDSFGRREEVESYSAPPPAPASARPRTGLPRWTTPMPSAAGCSDHGQIGEGS